MNENKDPFERFIVDENEPMNKQLVVEIIEPFVESIGKNKVIEYTKNFEQSPAWLKTIVYLCCRKVMLDGGIVSEEEVGPKEISQDVGTSVDSAKNISRDKTLKGLVSKKEGGYFIPNHKLKKAKEVVEKYGNSTKK